MPSKTEEQAVSTGESSVNNGGNDTEMVAAASEGFSFSNVSLEDLRALHSDFSAKRDWDKFHQPRNVALAMVGEVGEVVEHFQWRSDAECQVGLPKWTAEQKAALGEELSDVLIYLVRLADRCEIDLGAAVVEKMKKNDAKYPVDKAFGSSKKYTEL